MTIVSGLSGAPHRLAAVVRLVGKHKRLRRRLEDPIFAEAYCFSTLCFLSQRAVHLKDQIRRARLSVTPSLRIRRLSVVKHRLVITASAAQS